jgi:hypothetical protein
MNDTKTVLEIAREWADRNASGWLLELLYDESEAAIRGPLRGTRTCDNVAKDLAKKYGWTV